MSSWWVGVLLFLCSLLVGCGGNKSVLMTKNMAPPPAFQDSVDLGGEQEEALTAQLSAERLEELYAKSGIPGWDPAVEEELRKGDRRLKIDVPIHMNRHVKAYLVYFTTERKRTIRKYLSRSTRYLPMIREIFQEHGMPEDLAYLAMIESGFNPHAYSHAHACGMWQFIRGTGRRYGLTINNYVDERRDPEKATHAAAKYLKDLYKQFGSWYLAAASYNCGEGRVQREINASTHKNFWELSANQCLPKETKNYVPQMIAATLIAEHPERFGFRNIPYLPALKYEKVMVNEPTSLKAVAIAANVPLEEIQILNPELKRGVTPAGMPMYALKIPKGSSGIFSSNIMMARAEFPAIATKPTRFAKRSYKRRNSKKRKSSRKYVRSRKYRGKSRTKARGKKKSTVRTASKDRRSHRTGSTTVLASVVGTSKISRSAVKRASSKKSKTRKAKASKSRHSKKRTKKKISKSRSRSKSKRLASRKKSKSSRKKSRTMLMSKAR